ncbi:MAG: DNA topoisomerase III, partial [Deltaproteobacteria bacterium]|nr:DNA topoisomerase III [Deltaproteobacteria bacterium]
CCAAGTVIKGRQAYGCSCFREGCAFRIPFELAGKTLTAAQVKALVTKKRTPVIKGFTRDGVTFSARLGLDDEGRLIRLDE